jgi:hypothetical protein
METYRKHGGDWLTTGSNDLVFNRRGFLHSRKPEGPQSSIDFSRKKIINVRAGNGT